MRFGVDWSITGVTMAGTLIRLDVRTREAWRRWLVKHHASSPGVWLLRHKQHTGVRSMPYEDLVREALCFGWVDSLVKRLDENVYAIKVTPRQPASKWSDPNRKRWKELQAAGLLAGRSRGGSHREPLCGKAEGPGAADVHRRGTQDQPESLEVLSGALGREPA